MGPDTVQAQRRGSRAVARADGRLPRHARPRRRPRARRSGGRTGAADGSAALAGLSRRGAVRPRNRRRARARGGQARRAIDGARLDGSRHHRGLRAGPRRGGRGNSRGDRNPQLFPFPRARRRVRPRGDRRPARRRRRVPSSSTLPGTDARAPTAITKCPSSRRAVPNSPPATSRPSERCAMRRWR